MLQQLRKAVAALERPPGMEAAVAPLALGIPAIDAALGGGLAPGALHEIAAASEPHVAAGTGFALGLALRNRGQSNTIVWIAKDMALIENGAPCGLGLDEFGLAPERLISVAAARPRDLLWAMEEALHCPACTVIGELRQEFIEPVALRRLSLAAAASGALALLLRVTPSDEASTAATRWIVGAASSRVNHGPGPPRIDAQLVRNRRGPLGSWILQWSDLDERFSLASTHPQPVAVPALDRPSRAAVA
jgi:protein ImuA